MNDEETEGMLIKFAYDTKLGGVAKTEEDRARIQDDLDKLKNWAKANMMNSTYIRSLLVLCILQHEQYTLIHPQGIRWLI